MNLWKTRKMFLGSLVALCLTTLLVGACGESKDDGIDTGTDDVWNPDDTGSPDGDADGDSDADADTTPLSVQWSDDFESVSSMDEFWSIQYAALSDCSYPWYVPTKITGAITVADGSIKVYSSRFAIGMVGGENAAATTATSSPGGELNLTEGTVVTVTLSDAADVEEGDTDPGQNMFLVYVDNNTTSSDNATGGDKAKIIKIEMAEVVQMLEDAGGDPIELSGTVPAILGTTKSFLQVRTESGASVTIDKIEVSGEPALEVKGCDSAVAPDTDVTTDPEDTDADTGAASWGDPACVDVSKGDSCETEGDLCYKTCGPAKIGRKSETCESSVIVEGDCLFKPGADQSCYAIPATIDTAVCGTDTPQASTDCTVAECVTCSSSTGMYLDSSGNEKEGYCVCTGTWTCASTSAWPCPSGDGC